MGVSITMAGAPPFPALLVAATALLLLCWTAPPADALCDKGDKAVLLALKASLGNPANLASWKKDTDCCDSWGSVECDNRGRVILVDIQSTKTSGSIPASIADLTYLQHLIIRRCPKLTGPIPYNIHKLSNLQELNLEKNNLTGCIPATIGRLTRLNSLSLSENHLTGSLPYSIGRLHNLVDFYVDSNELTGDIPTSFCHINPVRANLSLNKLSGNASPVFAWERASTIDISSNKFCFSLSYVTFPKELTILNMSNNRLYGRIPFNADKMKQLQKFDVSHNQLCGMIPQRGVINKFPAASFADNRCLCGHPLPRCAVQAKHGLADQSYPVEASR